MDSSEKISANSIIAEVLPLVGDTELRLGLTLGYYKSAVQQAIEKMALETFYEVITSDFVMPKTSLQDNLPKNCFNIREIYCWSGACCSPETSVVVHYKRLYNNKPGGVNYTANRKESGNQDPFYSPYFNGFRTIQAPGDSPGGTSFDLHYANVQNGLIMFSSSCASFDNYRIVYNGMGGDIGDAPVIPRIIRDTVIDFVIERVYRALMAKEPRLYRILWRDAYDHLYNRENGTFYSSLRRLSSLSAWKRENYRQYQNRGDW